MQLNEEDKKKILDWINTKCGAMRCMCCGHGNWQLQENASIFLIIDVHTTRFFYHSGTPAVSLICAHCGHLVFFSTFVMGFKPDAPPLMTTADAPSSSESVSVTKS